MKTIFICIDWFYPAYKAGGPIQSIVNMIEQLAGEQMIFKVYCSNKDADGSLLEVKTNCWIQYNTCTEVWYAAENSISKKGLQQLIKDKRPDILFINGIYSWDFNIIPLLFGKAHRKIISVRGMLHPGALSQKSLKKRLYLTVWKLFRFHKEASFHASNEDERKYIQQTFGRSAVVQIAANFPKCFKPLPVLRKQVGVLKLVTIALISTMKNHLLVLKALKHCSQKIQYTIYGPVKDPVYWKTCLDQMQELPDNITIEYNGDIRPDHVEVALGNNHVFILPSKSENFGHALIESLFAGRPVITSNYTPWNDLQNQLAGLNIDTGSEREMTEALIHFALMKEDELKEWSNHANLYAQKHIHINVIRDQYKKMFS